MTLKDGYRFGGFSGTPPSEPNLSSPPPPPGPPSFQEKRVNVLLLFFPFFSFFFFHWTRVHSQPCGERPPPWGLPIGLPYPGPAETLAGSGTRVTGSIVIARARCYTVYYFRIDDAIVGLLVELRWRC